MACKRCGETTSFFITSMFNTDTICAACLDREQAHPDYEKARRAEADQVRQGNFNFPGIGLPADLR